MRMHLTSGCPAAISNTRKIKIWVNVSLNQEFFPPLDCSKSGQEKPSLDISGLRRFIFHRSSTISSVQFSRSVVSNSLRPRGLQHARPPCWSPLPEFTQTHVHWVGDAIQLSHPLPSPSFPTFNLSQHQSLFKWVSSLHQVAKVLEFQLQHQSFQWIFRTDFL